jgi:competence protein ComEA
MDRLLPWLRRTGWIYVVAALALAVVAWRVAARGTGGGQPGAAARPVVVARREAEELLVHVAGAVRRPGVYRIAGDGRVIQAVRLAGGPTRRADLSGLNLAAKLVDGQQVLVPLRVPAASVASGPGSASGAGAARAGPVSLSAATVDQLDALDGIGPALAARIVAWRAQHGGFASVDQLLDVPGIGQARLDAIRSAVVP